MAVSTEKIAVYNLADLKNTSDDALPNYLNSLKFKQTHALSDTRLAIGYAAIVIAAACGAWDYKFGFDATKHYTAVAVALYAVLNSALTLWIWLVEKGTVYEGTSPSGEKLRISTSTRKHEPIYRVKVTVTDKSAKESSVELAEPFNQWFDAQGRFVTLPFQQMWASGVPAIGRVDPKRIKSESQSLLSSSPEVLDMLLAASSEPGAASGADTPAKKGGKRRKA